MTDKIQTGATEDEAPVQVGDIIELSLDAVIAGGRAIARYNGMAVFVNNGLPGQRVRARIIRRKKRFAEADLVECIAPALNQCEPFCKHSTECGGCVWQAMPYNEQLTWKERLVRDAMERLAKLNEPCVLPVIPSPQQKFFRNKIEFAFGFDEYGEIALGLRARASHAIINLQECPVFSKNCGEILEQVRIWAQENNLEPWDDIAGKGFLRFLVLRQTRQNQLLVQLISSAVSEKSPQAMAVRQLAQRLCTILQAGVSGFIHGIRRSHTTLAYADRTLFSLGDTSLTEKIDDISLEMSADAFFQTNTGATEKLYEVVADMVGGVDALGNPEPVSALWDCYSGIGSIALFVAERAKKITAFEVNSEAVACADKNATALGIKNIDFVTGDLRLVLKNEKRKAPEVVVLDPPRNGSHPEVLEQLCHLRPQRIVYVSCDPASLARDITLLASDYVVEKVQPVDMFPHTAHIESVVLLTRK